MDSRNANPPDRPAPQRPHAWLHSLNFNDGTALDLTDDDIVVFVGPNNAGKSLALRELYVWMQGGGQSRVDRFIIRNVELEYSGDVDAAVRWVEAVAMRHNDGVYHLPMAGRQTPDAIKSFWRNKETNGLGGLAAVICIHLDTGQRLAAANPSKAINYSNEVPSAPLHVLYEDDDAEAKLDGIFVRAFGTNLIVNRGAGSQVILHSGKRPIPPNGDRQSAEFRRAVNALPQIQNEGDGIRSFVGILASVLIADRDVVFIDEPEAFLHPPQATLLGRVLAEETPKGRQLVLATHSSDFLKGLLDKSSDRVRVIRLQRVGNINEVKELTPETVKRVWSDPLLRYSKILDALFHQGAIVCEGDADCRFYEAMIDTTFGERHRPDVSLLYGAGKSRIPTIVRALRAVGVPVRVVMDFDALATDDILRRIYEELGGTWSDIESDWSNVNSAILARRPQFPTLEAKKKIDQIFAEIGSKSYMPDSDIKNIRDVLRGASAWAEAKRIGKRFIPAGDQTVAYERLAKKLRDAGLWLVEVGELEGFCPSVSGHGPGFVNQVLERDLVNDPELAAARTFAESLLSGWPNGSVEVLPDGGTPSTVSTEEA